MANTKLKLLRILEIISETDEEHPITAMGISDKLKYYGIEAERKSICRDINILKDDAGYDIVQALDNKQGYYMASREFEDWEVKILIDAVWGAKFLTKDSTEKLSQKLLNLTSVDSQKMLKTVTPVKSKIKGSNVTTKINIDTLLKAIKYGRKVVFQYSYTDTDLSSKLRRDGLLYVVNPYSLIWRGEYYYLVGNYDKYDDLSCYRLDRLRSLSISDEQMKPVRDILGANADFRLEEYVRASLYRYGGEKIKLTLEVASYMVDDLIDYFGTDLVLTNYDDKLRVTVDVLDSNGLYYWLLQYEKNVKVITPASVKDKLLLKVKDILKLYEEGNENG